MSRTITRTRVKQSRWWPAVLTTAAGSLAILNFTGLFFLQKERAEMEIPIPPPTPQAYLEQRCQENGYDCLLLNSIISCESGWRMVKNSSSSAYGYFQIIDGTERTTPQYAAGLRKFDPYANIDMGLYLYSRRGTSPWRESRSCWRPRYYQAVAEQNTGDIETQ